MYRRMLDPPIGLVHFSFFFTSPHTILVGEVRCGRVQCTSGATIQPLISDCPLLFQQFFFGHILVH